MNSGRGMTGRKKKKIKKRKIKDKYELRGVGRGTDNG